LAAAACQAWQFARRSAIARLVLLLGCLFGFTANAPAATLWQTWQAAQAHDPEFKAASAALAQARAAKPGALAALLPQVNGTLSRNYNNDSSEGPEYFGANQILPVSQSANTGTTNWQLELDQPLFSRTCRRQISMSPRPRRRIRTRSPNLRPRLRPHIWTCCPRAPHFPQRRKRSRASPNNRARPMHVITPERRA
jgi:hypothetical protein